MSTTMASHLTALRTRTPGRQLLAYFAAVATLVASIGPSPVAHAEADAAPALQEVVVTARKRDETLQSVPIAVSVYSGANLEQQAIQNTTSLFGRVPSLYFSQNNTVGQNADATFIVLRGVGSNPVLEPSTGLFVDGVYQSSAGFDMAFLDLERVEVLRGPQGTLFGRNTEAGAINLVTRQPGPDFQAKVFAEYDDQSTYRARGSIGGPLSEHWFAGLSAGYEYTNGYLRNLTLNRDQMAGRTEVGRLALNYISGDRLEMRFTGDASQTRGGIQGLGVPDDLRGYNVYDSTVRDQDRYNYGAAANIVYNFDRLALTSISGYRRTYSNLGQDIDGLPVPTGNFQNITQRQYTASQELRLASRDKDATINWLLGAYYFHETNNTYFTLDIPDSTGFNPGNSFYAGTSAFIDAQSDRKGWAGFGQVSWRPNTLLELTAGLRYSHENIDFLWASHLAVPAFDLVLDYPRTAPAGGPFKDSDTSPLGTVTLHWAKDFMTYASIGKGYKAGGFNRFATDPNGLVPFASETAINYEIGEKWTSADRRFSANFDVFYIPIKNQQLLATVPGTEGIPTTTIANAGRAESKGAELEIRTVPVSALTVGANLSYTDTVYSDWIDPDGVNRTGSGVPFVPHWNGSATAEYRIPVMNDHNISLFGAYRFVSSYTAGQGIGSDPAFNISGYGVLDLEVALRKSAQWKVALFCRNALDHYVITNKTYAYFFTRTDSAIRDTVQAPRTSGVNFSYSW